MSDQVAAFERHIKRIFPFSWELDLKRDRHGKYESRQIQVMHETWQAAQQHVALSDAQIDRNWIEAESEAMGQYLGGDIRFAPGVMARRIFARDVLSAQGDAPFTVNIDTMRESHRVTYCVQLFNNRTRPAGAKSWDMTGYITPFTTEIEEHAGIEAKAWAEFLGVTLNQSAKEEK